MRHANFLGPQFKQFMQALCCFVLLQCGIFSSFVMAQSASAIDQNPVQLLQNIANQMIAGLKARKITLKSNPQIVYSLASRYIMPYADLTEMSKRVLAPATWNRATPQERSAFQQQFARLLIRTYASALASYQDQTVKFYPIRGGYTGKPSIVVDSEITSEHNAAAIHVSYRLLQKGDQWRLYDMSVEGISLLESFRAQFADLLAQGTMHQLLDRLSQRH